MLVFGYLGILEAHDFGDGFHALLDPVAVVEELTALGIYLFHEFGDCEFEAFVAVALGEVFEVRADGFCHVVFVGDGRLAGAEAVEPFVADDLHGIGAYRGFAAVLLINNLLYERDDAFCEEVVCIVFLPGILEDVVVYHGSKLLINNRDGFVRISSTLPDHGNEFWVWG